jgi:hypothetical protein
MVRDEFIPAATAHNLRKMAQGDPDAQPEARIETAKSASAAPRPSY